MPREKLIKPVDEAGLMRVTVRLWESDFEYIRSSFPDNYNAQIRRIIGAWVSERKDAKEKS